MEARVGEEKGGEGQRWRGRERGGGREERGGRNWGVEKRGKRDWEERDKEGGGAEEGRKAGERKMLDPLEQAGGCGHWREEGLQDAAAGRARRSATPCFKRGGAARSTYLGPRSQREADPG